MSKKNRKNVVYSTNPDFSYDYDEQEEDETLEPNQQKLKVWVDSIKGGKKATVVREFEGSTEDLKELGKVLKSACGVGGSVKNGEIIIQGDHREKVVKLLIEKGYTSTKKSGGK